MDLKEPPKNDNPAEWKAWATAAKMDVIENLCTDVIRLATIKPLPKAEMRIRCVLLMEHAHLLKKQHWNAMSLGEWTESELIDMSQEALRNVKSKDEDRLKLYQYAQVRQRFKLQEEERLKKQKEREAFQAKSKKEEEEE